MKPKPYFEIKDFPRGRWTDNREIKFPSLSYQSLHPVQNPNATISAMAENEEEEWWEK